MLHRRQFLATALAAAPLRAAPQPDIIDTHTHFYDPSRPQGVPWPGKNETVLYRTTLPPRFVEMVRPLGVRGTVVIEASPWLEDNQWVLDLAKANPVIVAVIGHLEPGKPEFREHLRRFGRDRLFRGIRLGDTAIARGLEQPAFVEDMRRMADAKMVLDAIGSARLFPSLLTLTDRVPNLRVIIDHLPFESQAGIRSLAERKQIYAKVSGVLRSVNGRVPDDEAFYKAALDELWETFGADRVVYGSNWPVSDRVAPYATVLGVVKQYFGAKGAEASRKYFHDNSRAFYGWIDRG